MRNTTNEMSSFNCAKEEQRNGETFREVSIGVAAVAEGTEVYLLY